MAERLKKLERILLKDQFSIGTQEASHLKACKLTDPGR